MLAQAIESEVAEWIDAHLQITTATGHRAVVRNGHLPKRAVTTGLGPIEVRQPRVLDRRPGVPPEERFSSKILPPYLRKTKTIEELIPWLYLKGVSTGDFSEALASLLGVDAPGLSANTVTRLKQDWEHEQQAWSQRSLEGKEYVYLWVDGVHFNIRLEEDRQCILVVMGATKDGQKELIAVSDGSLWFAKSPWLASRGKATRFERFGRRVMSREYGVALLFLITCRRQVFQKRDMCCRI
jgi:transposase-like protein